MIKISEGGSEPACCWKEIRQNEEKFKARLLFVFILQSILINQVARQSYDDDDTEDENVDYGDNLNYGVAFMMIMMMMSGMTT